ncbi:MAG: hypothetical protein J1F61_00755 [Clostridiales bacterium]|nr:hypothetical protein [Clostridiales bacterium]
MERLTVKTKKGWRLVSEEMCDGDDLVFSAINRLAELEDKLESGELIDLSKLTTYQLSVGCEGTSSENYFIDEITPVLTQSLGMWSVEYKNRLCADPERGVGGRTLIGYFATKEIAEARLKELQVQHDED